MMYRPPVYTPPPKNRRRRWVVLGLVIVALLLAYWLWLRPTPKPNPSSPAGSSQQAQTKTQPQADQTIRLVAAGDMLPHDSVDQNAKQGGTYDYQQFFARVKPYLSSGDITYCNQESPTATGLSVSGYPTFNAPPEFSRDLTAVGCNLINLANNHADDKGQTGIDGTIDTWDKLPKLAAVGISRSAAQQRQISYFTVKGVKFAYLAYAECSNNRAVSSYGLNLLGDKSLVTSQVDTARKNADVVIVGTHWCRENVSTESATADSWAKFFAAHGVDIVIGTGPHYLQPVERLKKQGGGTTLVWFSLGNFLSTQVGIKGLIGGLALMDIDAKTKQITDIGFMPTYMYYYWTPAQFKAYDLAARKDLMLYPLDQAGKVLPNAVDKTTVAAQTAYVRALMNRYTTVPILTSKTFPTD